MSNYWPVAVLSLKSHTEKNLLFLLLLQKKILPCGLSSQLDLGQNLQPSIKSNIR